MNTKDESRLPRRLYVECLVGALMIAGVVALVRAFL